MINYWGIFFVLALLSTSFTITIYGAVLETKKEKELKKLAGRFKF